MHAHLKPFVEELPLANPFFGLHATRAPSMVDSAQQTASKGTQQTFSGLVGIEESLLPGEN